MTTAHKGYDDEKLHSPVGRIFAKAPLLRFVSVAIFLSVPLLVVFSLTLFKQGWEERMSALQTALCQSYWNDPNACAESEATFLEMQISEPISENNARFNTRYEVWLQNPAYFAFPGPENAEQRSAMSNEARCTDTLVATFDLRNLAVSQNATYDSIARRIEACSQPISEHAVMRLCTGTRAPLSSDFCGRSLEFLNQMQLFDRSSAGRAATVKIIVSSVSFGAFQLAALFLMLFGLSSALNRYISVTGVSKRDNLRKDVHRHTSLTSWTNACYAAEEAQLMAQDEDEQKRLQSFLLVKEGYRSRVTSAFQRTSNLGDIIVLIGLLGTLWGMLNLFSSLAESGSAEPLIAELAKSKMLGSLGLAFGTTIFAGILRLIFSLIIPNLKDAAEGSIDDAFSDQLRNVDFNIFGGQVPGDGQVPKLNFAQIGFARMQNSITKSGLRRHPLRANDLGWRSHVIFLITSIVIFCLSILWLAFANSSAPLGM